MAGRRAPVVLRRMGASLALRALQVGKWAAIRSYPVFEYGLSVPIPRWVEPLGARAALRSAHHAYRRVPAYREYVDASGWTDDPSLSGNERLMRFPITDKKTYIERYSTAARCLDGRIPLPGTEMDESSGSSGHPFDWVRGADELAEMHRQFSQYATYTFGRDLVTINGFSMGAWSTGVNTARAMRPNGMVKSPGPDLEKIIHTLRVLGPGHTFVITGYPPFLREILEAGESSGLDWRAYRMFGIVGGEAMSEQLRDRLLQQFVAVYSAYGASDLDIGVGAESPWSIWLRRQALSNPALRRQLFGDDPRLPMVFQFNPLDHNIETIDGELVITVSRLSMLSPRIRYNIHDAGSALSFSRVAEVCHDFGLDIHAVRSPFGHRPMLLPFMWVHGRSDSTISYMGANIYPEDVEQGLYADAALSDRIGAFALELRDIGDGAVRPMVHVELKRRADDDAEVIEAVRRNVVARLTENSRDFRAAIAENPSTADVRVELHDPGAGPFEENARRIKRRYIIPSRR
jgi:phenylacetate-coenzyme A ligase PaaK-like adenylate-forming protein